MSVTFVSSTSHPPAMLFNPEIEHPPQLQALQSTRWKEQVQYLNARGPFYQRRFTEAGIIPVAFQGLKDVPRLGFTKLKGSLPRKIKGKVGLSMRMNLLGGGQLPRSESDKLSRVKDLRELKQQ